MKSYFSRQESNVRADFSRKSLDVSLRRNFATARPDQNLLLAFHFGAGVAAGGDGPIVDPGLAPIDSDTTFEGWWYGGDVDHWENGDIRITECDDYACVILQREEPPNVDFHDFVRAAYQDVLRAAARTEHRNVARIWNYFASINEGEGNAERYRQFSVGRAEAFAAAGIRNDVFPAGTAIGCPDGGRLSIIALTTRHQTRRIENPRQVSAFHYPRQYGRKSPTFSRSVYVEDRYRQIFLISGTASVVGHESAHPHDTAAQTDETLQNLEHLDRSLSRWSDRWARPTVNPTSILRVYLRNPEDHETVAARLRRHFGDISENCVFLHGDICRRELTVEIDGVTLV